MSTERRIQPAFGGGISGFWCIEGFRVNHRILVLMGSPNEHLKRFCPEPAQTGCWRF